MYRKKLNKRYKNTDLSWTFDVLENVDKICGFDDYERRTKGQSKVQKLIPISPRLKPENSALIKREQLLLDTAQRSDLGLPTGPVHSGRRVPFDGVGCRPVSVLSKRCDGPSRVPHHLSPPVERWPSRPWTGVSNHWQSELEGHAFFLFSTSRHGWKLEIQQ